MGSFLPFLKKIDWSRPIASKYFRSAGCYLGLKLAILSLAGLINQYLLTHHLTKEDYGLIIWVSTIISLLSPLGLPGISTSITGAVAKGFDGNFRRGTCYEIIGSTFGGLVLLFFSTYYYYVLNDSAKYLMFLVAGVLGPGLWLDTHLCYWNGKKNFKAIIFWSVPVRLIQLASTAIVLEFSANPIFVFGIQTVIQVIANISAPMIIMMSSETNSDISEEYLQYGKFSSWLYVIGTFSAQTDKLIIGVFFGLKELAVFSIGELIYTYFYKTPAALLAQIFMPRLAEMEICQAAQWVRNRQKYLFLATTLLVVILAFIIPVIYPKLFTEKFNDSIYFCNWFLLCIIAGAPTFLSGSLHKSHALKKYTMRSWLVMTVTPLILLPVFSYVWGLTGIVVVRFITNVFVSIYYQSMTKRLSCGK